MAYYPPVAFYFSVKFGNISDEELDTQFQSVSGLSVELQTDSVKEGGENRFEHVLPVRMKYSNLIMKRGLIKDTKVIKWILNTFQGMTITPTDLTISLLNEKQEPLMTWNVVQAWPKKWIVDDLSAMDNKLVIESIELQYQYFSIL